MSSIEYDDLGKRTIGDRPPSADDQTYVPDPAAAAPQPAASAAWEYAKAHPERRGALDVADAWQAGYEAALRPPLDDLEAAWAEAEAALPEGWIFHGVELADHSMDGGSWGPDWMASMSWPGHCEYDDCDHDEAFHVANGPTPAAALRALAAAIARHYTEEPTDG
jgi:hypothetical protein